jgi:Mn-dependent DtxR family transcriptional regulator
MAKREFSNAFRTFVNNHISSVEQIEVLLLLLADPHQSLDIDGLSATLRSSPNSVGSRIRALEAAGLVSENGRGYRYTASGATHEMVRLLQKEYAERRFSVIELVYSRSDAARTFADAFRFKDEDDERHR